MSKVTKDSQKFYDAVADILDKEYYSPETDPCIAYDVERLWIIFEREIQTGDRVLEVGCGSGHWIAKISASVTPTVYGIDFSKRMVALAKAKDCHTVFVADAENLPFRSEVFDVVISPFDTLNHCSDYARAFAEVSRVLKVGGKALLMVDNIDRLISTYWNLSSNNIKSLGSDPRRGKEIWRHLANGEEVEVYSHFFSKREICKLLQGFRIEFTGIGTIPPLIPLFVRRKMPRFCKSLLRVIDPIETYLNLHRPGKAAHLFVIGRKLS